LQEAHISIAFSLPHCYMKKILSQSSGGLHVFKSRNLWDSGGAFPGGGFDRQEPKKLVSRY
jgi:hypothetical protein